MTWFSAPRVRERGFLRLNTGVTDMPGSAFVSVGQGETVDFTGTLDRDSTLGGTPVVEFGAGNSPVPTGLTVEVLSASTPNRKQIEYTFRITAAADAPPTDATNFGIRITDDRGLLAFAYGRVTVTTTEEPIGQEFVLSVAGPVNVTRDGNVAVPVTAVRSAGFTADIDLSIDEALPSGVTASFSPDPMGGTTSTLTLSASNVATLGQATITVRGTAVGSLDDTATLTFTVIGTGDYARFAPLYDLPRNEAGVPLGYDPATGGTTGDVYKPALPSPATLAATTNVVTVKASGGDYTPAQFQTALDAAINDTTQSWTIVVDSGLNIERSYSGSLGVFRIGQRPVAAVTPWLYLVCSDWYDGTWTPSASAHFDVDNDVSRCFSIVNTHTWTSDGQGATQLLVDAVNVGIVGLHIQRPATAGTFLQNWPMLNIRPTAKNVFVWHSLINGRSTTGSFRCARGATVDATNVYFGNSGVVGIGTNNVDTTAILSVEQGCHQFEWCMLESASINYLTGGQRLPYPEATVHDVLFRKCYFFKRQQFNPASHLYTQNVLTKNLFEPKYGVRMLVEDSVLEGSYQGAQNGMGIALSVSNQGPPPFDERPGYIYEVSNITFLNVIVRDVLAVDNAGGYTERPNTKPMYNIDFVNMLGVVGRMDRLHRLDLLPAQGTTYGWSISGGKRPPSGTFAHVNYPELIGNIQHRWCTVAAKAEKDLGETIREGIRCSWRTAYLEGFDGTVIENCVLMDSAPHAVNLTAPSTFPETGTATNRIPALWETRTNVRKTAMVKQAQGASRLLMTHTDFIANGNYPDQEDPDLFVDARTDLFTDPSAFDYSMKSDCTAKGKGDGGFDPGVDMALLNTRLAGVRVVPTSIDIDWVDAP